MLEHHGVVDGGGDVRRGVHLVSLGDHVDYPPPPAGAAPGAGDDAGEEGARILRWLGAQPFERVTILLGNHDASRVIELAALDDERFAQARALAERIAAAAGAAGPGAAREAAEPEAARGLRAEFRERFPEIPTPELARRDFASYTTAQRDLVRELLLSRRLRLAAAARLAAHPDVEVLLTHAGVTTREIALLGVSPERGAAAIAVALNGFLDAAVDRVREAWRRGEPRPLDLAPLHVAGESGHEGGGLLYHRPAEDGGDDLSWRFDAARPRRFLPQSLPRGLVQACGHTGPDKAERELARWSARDAAAGAPRRDVRLLSVRGDAVRYGPWRGERPPDGDDDASLLLVDATLHAADPADVPLLELLPPRRGPV